MMGINVNKCRLVTFGISAAFAAIAGILLSPIFYVSVDMGTLVGLKAFSAAILGGFGNIVGAMLGGIILGIVEALGLRMPRLLIRISSRLCCCSCSCILSQMGSWASASSRSCREVL